MKVLQIPNIPGAFIPLILKDKKYLEVLEIGEISNRLLHVICSFCQFTLKSLKFDGGLITYSGVISLFPCKATLTKLYIRNPKHLTKYSLHMLAQILVNLRYSLIKI